MNCSTIIVSYNTFKLTRKAVATALNAAPSLTSEIIVVDNNSPDNSAQRLRKAFPADQYPQVQVIANQQNKGFAAANNQGAAQASGEILFFLNSDTEVHGAAIRTLYQFLTTTPEAGAVGPRVLNLDGTPQKSTSSRLTIGSLINHHLPIANLLKGSTKTSAPTPQQTTTVDIVKGCALAVRRDAFDTVGGWDDSYFMYAEEREFCYALQEAGFTNYYLHEAVITHHGGASSLDNYVEQQIVHHQSVVQFLRRHHPLYIRALHCITGALGFGLRVVFFRILAYLYPQTKAEFNRRGNAAAALFWWFLFNYSAATETDD